MMTLRDLRNSFGGRQPRRRICRLLLLTLCWALLASSVSAATCRICDGKCGVLALSGALRLSGVKTAKIETAVPAGSPAGTEPTIESLEAMAHKRGASTLVTIAAVSDLSSAKVPAVALMWGDHFVAVQGDGHGGITATDPTGKTKYAANDFADAYSGVALFVSKKSADLPKVTTKGPAIRFEPYVTDFGRVFQTDSVEKLVKVKNTGSADLVIGTVRGTCSCGGAIVSGMKLASGQRIPPGEDGSIKLSLITSGRDGEQSLKFYVESNAVNAPLAQIYLMGRILRGQWSLYPSSLNFSSLRAGENATRQVQVSDPDGGKVEISEVRTEPDVIKCVLREDSSTNPSQRTLDVTVSEGTFKDNLNGKIILKTNHPKRPIIEIPVTASSGTPVSLPRPTTTPTASSPVGPPILDVFMPPTTKGKASIQTVIIKPETDADFDITKADSPLKFLTAQIEPKNEKGENRVTVTITNDAPAGTISGEIKLQTTNPKQPIIRLRVRGVVNEQ